MSRGDRENPIAPKPPISHQLPMRRIHLAIGAIQHGDRAHPTSIFVSSDRPLLSSTKYILISFVFLPKSVSHGLSNTTFFLHMD